MAKILNKLELPAIITHTCIIQTLRSTVFIRTDAHSYIDLAIKAD